jgi:pimeloyl-ACP methyl ester carboxylesterase
MRLTYGADHSQYAELLLPAGAGPAAVVVILHGGYWSASYGAELGQPLAADLSGSAVDALATDGQRLAGGRLDLSHVVALGHSTGGQLAGWLASRRGAAVPLTGAVLQAGVLDLVRAAEVGLGGGAVGDFLGGSPADVAQEYGQASPTALVSLGVPSICVHGTADTTVPLEQSERFVAAARAVRDQTELQTLMATTSTHHHRH